MEKPTPNRPRPARQQYRLLDKARARDPVLPSAERNPSRASLPSSHEPTTSRSPRSSSIRIPPNPSSVSLTLPSTPLTPSTSRLPVRPPSLELDHSIPYPNRRSYTKRRRKTLNPGHTARSSSCMTPTRGWWTCTSDTLPRTRSRAWG